MTEVKPSLWLRVQAARAHWMAVGATGAERNTTGLRWRNLRTGELVSARCGTAYFRKFHVCSRDVIWRTNEWQKR